MGAGLLVVVLAAVVATILGPVWDFDPLAWCSPSGQCPSSSDPEDLRNLGWAQSAGVVAVVVGLVLRVRALPAHRSGSAGVERAVLAVLAGGVGVASAAVLGAFVLVAAVLQSPHLLVAGVLVVELVQGAMVTALLTAGGPATRVARIAGPMAGASALLTTGASVLFPLLDDARLPASPLVYALLHGIALAVAVRLVGRGVTVRRVAGLVGLAAVGYGIGALSVLVDRVTGGG